MPSQLYLTIPSLPAGHAQALLRGVLQAAPFASARFSRSALDSFDAQLTAALISTVQDAGVAALVEDDAALAARLGADGVHITAPDDNGAAISAARALLPAGIIGAEAGLSRHLAMINGEKGADYVAFSRGVVQDHEIGSIDDMVQWWSELFQLPCVAFAGDAEAAARLAQLGADFIALDTVLWAAPDGPAAAAKHVAALLE